MLKDEPLNPTQGGIIMNIQSVSNLQIDYSKSSTQIDTKNESIQTQQESLHIEASAVYEKSTEEPEATYTADMDKVIAMKEETDERLIDLFRNMVKGGTLKQIGGLRGFIAKIKGVEAKDLESVDPQEVVEFEVEITDEAVQKAQADVAEDGYWGAEAVSDRFLEFAVALSGDNPEKADMLLDAVKAGYEAAEEIWGSELPQLSQDTLALTIEKFEAWRDGEA